MTKRDDIHKKTQAKIANILAEVPIDDRKERDDLHARLSQRYSELEPLKWAMSKKGRDVSRKSDK